MRFLCKVAPVVKISARLSCNSNIRRYTSIIYVRNKQRVCRNYNCHSSFVRSFGGDKCNSVDKKFLKNKEMELGGITSPILPIALIDSTSLSCKIAKVLLIPLNWHDIDEHVMKNTLSSILSKNTNRKKIEAFSQALREVTPYTSLEETAPSSKFDEATALLPLTKVKSVSNNSDPVQKYVNDNMNVNDFEAKSLDHLATAVDKTLEQCCLHSMQMSADNRIIGERMKLCALPLVKIKVEPENSKQKSVFKIDISDINLGDITWHKKIPFPELQNTLTDITFPTSLMKKSFTTNTTPSTQQKLLCAPSSNLKNKDKREPVVKSLNARSASHSASFSQHQSGYSYPFLSSLFGTEEFLMNCDTYNKAIKETAKRKAYLNLSAKHMEKTELQTYKRPKVLNIKGCTAPTQNLSTVSQSGTKVTSPILPPPTSTKLAKTGCGDDPCNPVDCPDPCKDEKEKLERIKEEKLRRKRKKLPTGCVSPKCKKEDTCRNLKKGPCKKASSQSDVKSSFSNMATTTMKLEGGFQKVDPYKPVDCPDPTGCISPKCKKDDSATLKKSLCKELDSANQAGLVQFDQKKKNNYCEKGKAKENKPAGGKTEGKTVGKPKHPCYDYEHHEYVPKCNTDPCKQSTTCGGSAKKESDGCTKKKPEAAKKCKTDSGKKKDRRDPCKRRDEICGTGGEKKKDPCGGEKKKDPCGGEKKKDPCGGEKKKDPCGGEKKKDPCGGEKKKDPCGGEKKKDPCGGEKKDPCGGEKKKDPCGGEKKKDPCGGEKKKDPCGGEKKKDPCGDLKKEAPCGGQKKEAPCGGQKKKVPCAGKKKKVPCAGKKKKSPCGSNNKPSPCKSKSTSSIKSKDSCGKKRRETKPNCNKSYSTVSMLGKQIASSVVNRSYSTHITLPRIKNKNMSSFGFLRHYSSKKSVGDKVIDHGKASQCKATGTKVPPHRKPAYNPHPKDGIRKCFPIYDMDCSRHCKKKSKKNFEFQKASGNKKRDENRQLVPQNFSNKLLQTNFKNSYFRFHCKFIHQTPTNWGNFFFTDLLPFYKEKENNAKEVKCVKRPAILNDEEYLHEVCADKFEERNGIFNETMKIENACVIEKLITDIPKISDYDALINPIKIAISDYDIYCYETGVGSGCTLGHDAAGIVLEVGRNIKHLKPGDRVVVEAGVSCGICDFCKKGAYNMCTKLRYNGFLTKFQSHPADLCFKLPHALSLTEAALIPTLALGCQAVFSTRITPASNVLIMGSGSTAVACALCAHAIGAKQVVLMCTTHASLESIRKIFGFDYIHYNENSDSADQLETIFYQFHDWPDVVINCAVNDHTMLLAVIALKPCGSCILTECDTESVKFNAFNAIMKNIRLISSYRSNNMFPMAINLMSSGRVPLFKIINSVFTWENIDEAFRLALNASNSGYQKIVVQCGDAEKLPKK